MPKQPKVPNTISEQQMKRLQRKARKANPDLDSLASPRAIARRLASRNQRGKAGWN